MNAIATDRAKKSRCAVLDDVIPFRGKRPVNHEHGGYSTCLGREGPAFSADKNLRLEARKVSPTISFYARGSRGGKAVPGDPVNPRDNH